MNNIPNKKLRAAIYVRVSTDEQTKGYGLSVQKDKLQSFIASQEYEILDPKHIYSEEGFSGTLPIPSRPELKRLFENAKNKEFDVVLVYRLDRFFRKTQLLLEAIEQLVSYDVGFRSITESFDTTSTTGKFMTTLLGAVAEMERDTIRERTTGGRLSAARAGKWAVGLPPYGYKVNKKTRKLEIVQEEACIVKKFYEWLVHERLSLKSIAKRINQMNVDSPKFKSFKKRKTYNHWYERTIGRLLTNEIYTGTTYFRKYKRPFNNLTSLLEDDLKRPQEDWVKIPTPPIITTELFEQAKQQLTRNRDDSIRNMKREYLFAKLIYCGYCRHKMFCGYQAKGDTRYYHGVFLKPDTPGTTQRCTRCEQYAETRLEPIWDCLKSILKNPNNLKEPLERYRFKTQNKALTKEKIKGLEQRLKTIEVKERKLVDLYLNHESMPEKEYKEMSKKCRDDKEEIRTEIMKLNQSLVEKEVNKNRHIILDGLYKQIQQKLDQVTYTEKAKIIHLFIERINLYQKSNYAEVIFKFPTNGITGVYKMPDTRSKEMKLILDIKTITKNERKATILISNPLMYKGI